MPKCKICGRPVTTVPVYHPECLKSERGWISVEDRMPKPGENVLTCDHKGNMHIMFSYPSEEYPFNIPPWHTRFFMPTHWMPLPEPPKEEVKEE